MMCNGMCGLVEVLGSAGEAIRDNKELCGRCVTCGKAVN